MKTSSLGLFALVLFAVITASAQVPPGEYELIIWNQYNGAAKDRGTKACKVEVFSDTRLLWADLYVKIDWTPSVDTHASVQIPKQITDIDHIRVSVIETLGNGGGLAEIELMHGGVNIARNAKVSASAFFQNDQRFSPQRVIDGITSSKDMFVGYWLLPNDKTGWIELKLPRP